MKNKFFITITDSGNNPLELRLILNKLNCWTKPQIDKYLKEPFEFEVDLDQTDLTMVILGLEKYCIGVRYSIIDLQTKRNNKLQKLEI